MLWVELCRYNKFCYFYKCYSNFTDRCPITNLNCLAMPHTYELHLSKTTITSDLTESILLACTCNKLIYLLSGMQLACRPPTKVLHFCLSLAIFSIVPQEWFNDFSSSSTVRLHAFFGLSHFHFPSGVQWNAVLVMEVWYLLITCPIHCQRLLIKIVAILSWFHCLSKSSLAILLGQKMRRILLKLLVWKSVIRTPI